MGGVGLVETQPIDNFQEGCLESLSHKVSLYERAI